MMMPSYFVLIAADGDRNRLHLPSAYDLAIYRLKRMEWGLKDRTRYRKVIKPDDRVLIYISGHRENAQHFVATATVASFPKFNTGGTVDSPVSDVAVFSDYKVALKDICYFSKPVCVRDLLEKFNFVAPTRRSMWRIYFQGGAIKLQVEDFDLVVGLGG